MYDGFDAPTAPEDRPAYEYEVTESGFKLCSTFAYDSQMQDMSTMPVAIDKDMVIKNPDNWSYKAGRYCFERITK
jgi:hypothetical protein